MLTPTSHRAELFFLYILGEVKRKQVSLKPHQVFFSVKAWVQLSIVTKWDKGILIHYSPDRQAWNQGRLSQFLNKNLRTVVGRGWFGKEWRLKVSTQDKAVNMPFFPNGSPPPPDPPSLGVKLSEYRKEPRRKSASYSVMSCFQVNSLLQLCPCTLEPIKMQSVCRFQWPGSTDNFIT